VLRPHKNLEGSADEPKTKETRETKVEWQSVAYLLKTEGFDYPHLRHCLCTSNNSRSEAFLNFPLVYLHIDID